MKRSLLLILVLAVLLGLIISSNAQTVDSDFTYQEGTDGNLTITGYIGQQEEMIIPSTIAGRAVRSIANEAFSNNGRIVRAVIPEGVSRIGKSAFQGAFNLIEITLPNSLRTIEESAFNSCYNLKNISLPTGITTVAPSTFLRCMALEMVSFPVSLRSIEDYAFAITGLKQIELPFGIQTIGKHSFYGNGKLTSIIIPNSVTRIDDYAFFVCDSLTSVVLPTSLQTMSAGIFDKCPNLETIAIPMTVKRIRDDSIYSGPIKPEKLKILGPSGSEAERLAGRVGLPFEDVTLATDVSLVLNGEDVSNKLYTIDLSSSEIGLDLSATSQPETLWSGVVWSSSSPSIASVDSNGRIIALKKGEVKINAIAADGGGAQASLKLNIANLVKEININGNSDVFSKAKLTFKADVLPSTADNKNVEWSVSDSSIASINSKGALKVADVTQRKNVIVTATAKDGSGIADSFELTVYPLVAEAQILNNNQIIENKGTLLIDLASGKDTIQLSVKNSPADSIQKMTWKSSSNKIATVSEQGLVTGLRSGKANISATTSDGTKKAISFTVNVSNLIKEISISGAQDIAAEQGQALKAIILPESANNKKLEWISSDRSIARVNKSNGHITARKTDSLKQVTITASAIDGSGVSAEFTLNIHPLTTSVIISQDGIFMENKAKQTVSLALSEKLQLDASIEPSDAIQQVIWKSSDERVALVDENGLVTFVKKGKATITATASDGSRKRAACEFIISE